MEKGDQIVTLETYYDPMLAEIIKGKLEANGISCYLGDEYINTIMPIYNQLTGGVKLRVFERDLEKAKLVIAEDDHLEIEEESLTDDTVICPNCSSKNTRYGQATERKHGWFGIIISFLASIAFVVGIYPFYAHKTWHCFNCCKDFSEPVI